MGQGIEHEKIFTSCVREKISSRPIFSAINSKNERKSESGRSVFVHLARLLCTHMILQHVDDGYAHCYRGVRGKMLSEVSTVLEGRRERRRERKKLRRCAIRHGRLEL